MGPFRIKGLFVITNSDGKETTIEFPPNSPGSKLGTYIPLYRAKWVLKDLYKEFRQAAE